MRLNKIFHATALLAFAGLISTCTLRASAQGITVYQYRQVQPENVDEFIKRETTYWSEVAKKAIDKGNLTFWALLEQVGGHNTGGASTFMFINTYNDIDATDSVWSSATASFPGVPLAKMETYSISKHTGTLFVKEECWQASAKAGTAKFVKVNFITSNNSGDLIELERKHWLPFIKAAMDANQTSQVAWGNAMILSPLSDDIKATSFSYDLYPSLKEALTPTWDSKVVFPNTGLAEINKLEVNRRGAAVYRIVKTVSK
jgi:hypothetical protein